MDRRSRLLTFAASTSIALGALAPLSAAAQDASMAMPELPAPEKTDLVIGL